MSAFRVAIRVDSGLPMGSGHLMRCLTLADELRRRGAQVRFLSRQHEGHLIGRLEDQGYRVDRLARPRGPTPPLSAPRQWLGVPPQEDAQESLALLAGEQMDLLIVDHYSIDAEWERALRVAAAKVLVIDDLADRSHDADYLLDQSYVRDGAPPRYAERVPEHCRLLLGPRYALLQPVYRELRRVMPLRGGTVQRILVFFGAHDPTRSVLAVAQALTAPQFADLAIDVVPGHAAELAAAVEQVLANQQNVSIHENLPSLAGLIARADLAVGAGGTTTWERACLGVPSIVATIADNQVAIAAALAAEDMIVAAGSADELTSDSWCRLLAELLADRQRLAALELKTRTLTDGQGAPRVARVLMSERAGKVVLRRATSADESLLLEWANDAQVRRYAFNQAQIDAQTHHRWFAGRLRDRDCMILIGEDECGVPLGQVRFNAQRERNEAVIHISVDRDARGAGVGRLLLTASVERWASLYPQLRLVAEVLVGNVRSQRMFEASGFRRAAPRRADSIAYEYWSDR